MRQGDTLSPTLFCLFINDLVKELNDLKKGIEITNAHISILLYADDVVLITENESNCQCQLDILHS